VALRKNDIVYITLSSKEGLKEGMELTVYRVEQVKDEEGNVIFEDVSEIGKIKVLKVSGKGSSARVLNETTEIEKGDIVKLPSPQIQPVLPKAEKEKPQPAVPEKQVPEPQIPTQQAATGYLKITVENPELLLEAKLFIDERLVSLTRDMLEEGVIYLENIPAGKRMIKITGPAIEDFVKEIEVKKDELAKLDIKLEKAKGELLVKTEPIGASVVVDGRRIEDKTPTLLKLPVGRHEVVVGKEGFKSERFVVLVVKGKRKEIDLKLGRKKERYIFALEFADRNIIGVNVDALRRNGYKVIIKENKVIWNWSIMHKSSRHVHIMYILKKASGTIEYHKDSGKFLIGISDIDSLKYLLTIWGALGPANVSRVFANWIFSIISEFIRIGAIKINDRSLWNEYWLWWRAMYIPSFKNVTVYNNTGYKLTIVIGFLYGNEMWGYPGKKPEADKRWWLPLAKRWRPFDKIDDNGFVKENGEAYIKFSIRISNAPLIFGTANAISDNGERSKVEINGATVVSQRNIGRMCKQFVLKNGEYTIKLSGFKTWSYISSRIGIIVFDGNVEVLAAEIYPDKFGDPHPMIITIPQGISLIEYQESFPK
ncbi:MAG: PEGA domain-containing protein, partial [Thermotogae bacterium]|nr:PEGA domain-containing protein [Thermotogota bacterium]